jgi:transposase
MKSADPATIDGVSELQRKLREQRRRMRACRRCWPRRRRAGRRQKRRCSSRLRLLLDSRFGPSTEKYRVEQQDLFFDEAESAGDAEEDDADDER